MLVQEIKHQDHYDLYLEQELSTKLKPKFQSRKVGEVSNQ